MKKYFLFLFVCLTSVYVSNSQISSDYLLKHISFLASDSLKGRFPVSQEATIAASYIAQKFKQYNLKPLCDNGFQTFEIWLRDTVNRYELKINNKLQKIQDYQIFPFSSGGNLKNAEIVFAGYGIIAQNDTLEWNDYKYLDVKNKVVMVFRGMPNTDDFVDELFEKKSSDYNKALNAYDKGAKGIILIDAPDNETPLKDCKFSRQKMETSIPAIRLNNSVLEKLLNKSKISFENLYQTANQEPINQKIDLQCQIDLKIVKNQVTGSTSNVVFMIEGTDVWAKNKYIVVGAHYDHLGMGGCQSGSRMPDTLALHNGADDNASGVAGIIELARYFSVNKPKMSMIFVAFSAEERGLLGSNYFVKNLLEAKDSIIPMALEERSLSSYKCFVNKLLIFEDSIVAMINFDMIGRTNGKLSIMGVGTGKEFAELINSVDYDTNALDVKQIMPAYSGSDHASFTSVGIPALFFYSSTGENYHTPFDDVQFINAEKSAEVLNFAAKLIEKIDQSGKKITFEHIASDYKTEKRANIKVKLGIMPSFEDTQNKGLKIEGVSPNSVAEKSGMQKGDIIVEINNQKVGNLTDYTIRMSNINPGEKCIFKVLRNDEFLQITVQF